MLPPDPSLKTQVHSQQLEMLTAFQNTCANERAWLQGTPLFRWQSLPNIWSLQGRKSHSVPQFHPIPPALVVSTEALAETASELHFSLCTTLWLSSLSECPTCTLRPRAGFPGRLTWDSVLV